MLAALIDIDVPGQERLEFLSGQGLTPTNRVKRREVQGPAVGMLGFSERGSSSRFL
jgi:hypothetical protein